MHPLQAFNFRRWIDENRAALRPPVGNKRVFRDGDFVIMVVGGPNARKDYHVDPGEEFFYQLEGDMVLKTIQDGRPIDVPIREGEVLLLPPVVPHSPQRRADTVGLVVERQRHAPAQPRTRDRAVHIVEGELAARKRNPRGKADVLRARICWLEIE